MIILDFETNSANIHDVIEVAAFRIKREAGVYIIIDTFHRYYFSEYEVNPYALAVHKLSPQRIQQLRANGQIYREIKLFRCWPSEVGGINFDMGSSEFVTFDVTLTFDHLEIITGI